MSLERLSAIQSSKPFVQEERACFKNTRAVVFMLCVTLKAELKSPPGAGWQTAASFKWSL